MSKTLRCSGQNIAEINDAVRGGGVIVFPTDTVYGIGCDPYDWSAVQRIYRIKRREQKKPLPVLAYSIDDLEGIVEMNPNSRKIAERFWPGQVTMVLGLKDPDLGRALGIEDKIAVRVPGGECVRRILEKCRLLVGTSANLSGAKPFVDPRECIEGVPDYDVFVDGGTIEGGGESTVVDLTGEPVVVREGAVTKEEIGSAV